MSITEEFEKADDIKELFDVVKDTVRLALGESRAGIDIGFMELGNGRQQLLSAFHPVGSNVIVMNKTPLKRVMQTQPELMKPYVYVVLLHEYLHSLGYLDEATVRHLTYSIAKEIFNGHIITDMAKDLTKYFPFLLYPGGHPAVNTNEIELVELDDVDYIG
ncbi:hypothetical protein HY501_01875 [Candidatus Woesearchaeota archaeon]|nr:hypothetical protein [Candidatus Woesearchaeota archaeon]